LTNTITLARKPAYEDDDSEALITKATWPLKLSGVLFAGLLVIGRSASYGNITWTPAYHSAISPLVVVHQSDGSAPAPAVPKSVPLTDPWALSKRSAAEEVIVFSPGSNSGEDGENDSHEKESHDKNSHDTPKNAGHNAQGNDNHPGDVGTATADATAQSPNESPKETPGEATGQQASPASPNTAKETPNETPGEATGQQTTSANAANGAPNNGHDNGQVNNQANGLDPTPAAWLGRAEQTPWAAGGALAALGALIGLAFLKPWRFLRRFIR